MGRFTIPVLLLSALFAQAAWANETASAAVFLSVHLEPEFSTESACAPAQTGATSKCIGDSADYSAEQTEDALHIEVAPVVRVTVEPI